MQYNQRQNIPSAKEISIPEQNMTLFTSKTSIKLISTTSKILIVEFAMTKPYNYEEMRQIRRKLLAIIHGDISEHAKTQIQNILEWLNQEIQSQRRQKILHAQLRHS